MSYVSMITRSNHGCIGQVVTPKNWSNVINFGKKCHLPYQYHRHCHKNGSIVFSIPCVIKSKNLLTSTGYNNNALFKHLIQLNAGLPTAKTKGILI